MAPAELQPQGPAVDGDGQPAILGRQREGSDAVPRCSGPDVVESVLDVCSGRRLLQRSAKRNECRAGHAPARLPGRQPEEPLRSRMSTFRIRRPEQRLHRRASSGAPQTTVVQPPPQTIVIQPAQPDVVYVPTYNPTVVYGAPVPVYPGYVAPAYSTGAVVATGLISFGIGMAIGASMNNGCCGWGYNSWGCGWHNSSVTYNRNVYVSNSNTFVNRNNYYNRNNIKCQHQPRTTSTSQHNRNNATTTTARITSTATPATPTLPSRNSIRTAISPSSRTTGESGPEQQPRQPGPEQSTARPRKSA